MNLIAVDIGNSTIIIGFFPKSGLIMQKIDTLPLKTLKNTNQFLRFFYQKIL